VRYLLDTSAFWQGRTNTQAKARLRQHADNGELAVCAAAMLEILVSARNRSDWVQMRDELGTLPRVEPADSINAVDLQATLADRGQHRTPIIDVMIAATAAEHGLTVLHYDRDFERLSKATGTSQEWVIPAGTGHQR